MICGYIDSRTIKKESFRQTTLFFGNTGEAFQLFCIDDGEIKASLGAVIEEDGVDDLTGIGRQAEGDIRDPQDCLDIRDLLFDETDCLNRLDRAANIVLITRGAGEDQRINDDVL